jgi:hypothetical protein
VGNGKSTVEQLIEEVNRDPQRGDGHDNVLTRITIDKLCLDLLQKQGYAMDSVVPPAKEYFCARQQT